MRLQVYIKYNYCTSISPIRTSGRALVLGLLRPFSFQFRLLRRDKDGLKGASEAKNACVVSLSDRSCRSKPRGSKAKTSAA